MNKHLITLCLAATMLTACGGPGATQSVTKAGEAKGGFMGLSTQDSVKVDTADAFKGVEEVVVGGFSVAFDVSTTDSAKAGGGLMGSGFGGKSSAKSKLTGVSDAVMQQITDAAYNDFVAELKAKGYKVADRSAFIKSDDLKDTKVYANPTEDTQGGMLGGGNTTKYFAPSSFGGLRLFQMEIPGTMGGLGFSNAAVGAANYAQKTGKKVVSATYKVDFANAESYGGTFTSSSNVSVGQGLTVVPEYTKIGIVGGQGGTFSTNIGSIKLGQPITSDKEFAKVEDSTTDTDKAVQVATNVVGLLGGVGTNASRKFEFKARPDAYKAATLDSLKKANDALVGKMKELK